MNTVLLLVDKGRLTKINCYKKKIKICLLFYSPSNLRKILNAVTIIEDILDLISLVS